MATFKKYGCKSEKKQLKLLKVASPREQDKAWEREQELQLDGTGISGGFYELSRAFRWFDSDKN